MKRDSYQLSCTDRIASDPRRVLLSPPDRWDSRAEKINAAMDSLLCPADTPCWELDVPRSLTDADVAAVRRAVAGIGCPGAEVRPAQPGDGGPPAPPPTCS
jgi:hypothetical protein